MRNHAPHQRFKRRLLLTTLLLALVAAPMGAAVAYAPITDADGNELEPNPRLRGNVTIGAHKAACGEDPLCYFDDSDNQKTLSDNGFALDPDVDEPIRIQPQKVDCQYYGEDTTSEATKRVTTAWCANVSDKAWLDTAQWTATNEANDTFERVVRNGAHALHIKNAGGNPGVAESDSYVLDFKDISTDAEKHRFVIGIEVVGVSSALDFQIYDANGTGYNYFRASNSAGVKADGSQFYVSNGTGTVLWDNLVTEGEQVSGGISGDIGKLGLSVDAVSDVGATEVYVYALALQVKRFELGTDADGDPVYNMTYTGCDGAARSTPLGYACIASLAPNFQYTTIKDLKVAYYQDAGMLPDTSVSIIESEISTGEYDWRNNYRFTFSAPKMIDLTYAGDEKLELSLPVAGKQFEVLKANAVDQIKDVEKKAAGATVTLIASPPIGKEYEVEATVLYTASQSVHLTEVGFLGLPADNLLSKIWVWLAGLGVIGFAFAKALRRKRST